MDPLSTLADQARAWPFEEARRLHKRFPEKPDRPVLFETGYGPSGLPHIGTFGEVVRTSFVRRAFELLTGWETRLVCFSDDMDGLRKVPSNLPEQEMLARYAEARDEAGKTLQHGSPLTDVPDPFGAFESFAHHNNARLCAFLDGFGFEYEFQSATMAYRAGLFDETLKIAMERYDQVREVVLPTLGPERKKSYSPFLPIIEREGRRMVLHNAIVVERDPANGRAVFENLDDGERFDHPITGGHCKLQWRPDWAMRWVALGVDYEMAGKDLIDSVKLSGRIARVLGGRPPEGFNYELFLDEEGRKISKSKGNGLAVEEWLRYAPAESLSLYMFQQPRRAKRLYFDVIPKAVDEYLTFADKYGRQDEAERLENPAFHIHAGPPPASVENTPVSFALLLNLASAVQADAPAVLWGFVSRYAPGATAQSAPYLARLIDHAVAYYRDFVAPTRRFRAPDAAETAALRELMTALNHLPEGADGEAIQTEIYEIGKRHPFENLRDWFKALYQILLGQDQGPRFGSFVALYGIPETRELIRRALEGELVAGVAQSSSMK